jgi:hypothetical protein
MRIRRCGYFSRLVLPLLILGFLLAGCISRPTRGQTIRVLQLNVWLNGTQVKNGVGDIVDFIVQTNADLVTLSEVENYNNRDFISALIDSLAVKGRKYYGRKSFDSGLISRFPITDQETVWAWKDDHGSITKAGLVVGNHRVVLYSVHLDYLHYGPYLPRGYDGFTWKKLPAPVTSADTILQFNDSSMRIGQIKAMIGNATLELQKGSLVFIGGDFNEPSHLDWVVSTKDLFDHMGLAIPWTCTKMLSGAGFTDAYRDLYADPVTHPGITYPSDNPEAGIDHLAWAPAADDRDRIDFIFYRKNPAVQLKEVYVAGPQKSIAMGERIAESSGDPFIIPRGGWPSDHKGVLAIFHIQ